MVRYLCELPPERGVDPSAHGSKVFREAVRTGCSAVVQYLCQLPHQRQSAVAMTVTESGPSPHNASLCELGIVRPLGYATIELGAQLEPHPFSERDVRAVVGYGAWDVARFLTLELPGGSRWLPLVEALRNSAMTSRHRDSLSTMLSTARRERLWRATSANVL